MYLICVHVNSKYNKESKPYFLHALTRLFFVAYFSKNLSLSPCCSPSFYFQYSIQIMNPHQAFTSSFGGQKSTNKLNLLLPPEISKGLLAFRYTTKADGHPLSHEIYVPFCLRDAYHDRICDSEPQKYFLSTLSSFLKCSTIFQRVTQ